MTANSVKTKTITAARNDCYEYSDEDESSSNLEVDVGHGSLGFDFPALDATGHGTTVVNMKDSANVEIKPATYFHGAVTIHQYINGHSSPQNSSQPGSKGLYPKSSQNDIGSVNTEALNRTGQKYPRGSISSNSCKLGLILAVIGTIFICILIVYFTILKHDMGDDTPIPLPPPEEGDSDLGNDIHIIRRERWGGQPIRDGYQNRTLVYPINLVIIGHTGARFCFSVENCSSILQTIQTMHVMKGYVDVAYNYLIGGDGNIYEALAWNIRNYIRNNSIMISFFGNYVYHHVNDRQKMALKLLLNEGVKLGKLDPNYRLVAHSQVTNTLSPGTNLLEVIKRFPHYYNGTIT